MSVPKSKRNETPLSVLTEAHKLACYTIRLCSNENKFPKRYRWCLAKDIIDSAVRAAAYAAKANAIYVNDSQSYVLRRDYQQKAIAEIAGMQALMDIAFRMFSQLRHTGEDEKQKKQMNIAFWTDQLIKTKALLLAWKKSDTERFKKGQSL